MRPLFLPLLLLATGFYPSGRAYCQSAERMKLNAELPYLTEEKKLAIDLYYTSTTKEKDTLLLSCYKYIGKGDSILLFSKNQPDLELLTGAHSKRILLTPADKHTYYLPIFYKIIHKTGLVPAGSYKTYISLKGENGAITEKAIPFQVDSTLPPASPLKSNINNTLLPKEPKRGIGKLFSKETSIIGSAAQAIENNSKKLDRVLKAGGLSPQVEKRGTKEYINLYYEDWYVGRYEAEWGQSITGQIEKQKAQLTSGITAIANTELEGYKSLFTQVRELAKQKKEDKELRGQVGVTGNWSNGQPEYSTQDNNYYELRGSLETEIADIPVSVDGYYTTQDAHRTVKASYIRVHYDADKAKAELLKLIGGFKQQYSNTVAKGKGLEQVYGSYLSNLSNSKGELLNQIKRETGLYSLDGKSINTDKLKDQIKASLEQKMRDTAALKAELASAADSSGNGGTLASTKDKAQKAEAAAAKAREKARLIEDSATHLYEKAMKRYEQIQALEKKIEKYSALIEQYKNTAYFDSALAYAKVGDLKNADEATYKQLVKRASGLLPEGKAKKFITGLTNLDAGIFPKYVSKYTMAGQQLKGLDVGYDIGFAQIGITIGKTEYAGRDGSLDKYATYGARALFTPIKDQKIGLVYYGYTPSKSLVNSDNDFYKNVDIALPTFRQPIHIVSATYEGTIAKNVHLDGEVATSYRNGTGQDFKSGFDADRIAWHLTGECEIPKTGIGLTGSYEHGGKEFRNSTLPLLVSGTDLYKAGAKGDFFKSFLTLGVEFNHMQQSSFYTTGGNNRWGFEIATHSKQYPSLSLSYKPFATFRSYADTLSVPQRPLIGAVWTGKVTYQIKKKGGISWRFSLIYNKSTSKSDSVSYGSNLLQANIIYTTRKWMGMLSGGQSSLQTSGLPIDTLNPAHVKTTFGMGTVSYNLSKQMSLSGGGDIGFASFGLSKYGLNAGLNYRMVKAPISIRLSGRYSSYRLAGYSGVTKADATTDGSSTSNTSNTNDPMNWRRLYSGSIDIIWQIKMKVNK